MNGNMTPEERGRVIMMGVLRAGVAAYLIYLGYSLIRDHLNGSSTLAPWISWVFGVFFMLAGAGFAWYAWKRYRKDTQEKPADEGGNSPEEIPGTAEILQDTEPEGITGTALDAVPAENEGRGTEDDRPEN